MKRYAKLIALELALRTAKRHAKESNLSDFGRQNIEVALSFATELKEEERNKSGEEESE